MTDNIFTKIYYVIPSDLKVYVLSASPENPMSSKYNVHRPESLKQWKHGYSSGIAISEKENLVIYWFMQW